MEISHRDNKHIRTREVSCTNCGSTLIVDLNRDTISYHRVTVQRRYYPYTDSYHSEMRNYTDEVGTILCPVCGQSLEVTRRSIS